MTELATLLAELTALLTELSTELRSVPPVAAVMTLDSELVTEEKEEPSEDVMMDSELERAELTDATTVLLLAAEEPAAGDESPDVDVAGLLRLAVEDTMPAVPWPAPWALMREKQADRVRRRGVVTCILA